MIGHLLASRSVDPERTVVVYDDRSGMRAARVIMRGIDMGGAVAAIYAVCDDGLLVYLRGRAR